MRRGLVVATALALTATACGSGSSAPPVQLTRNVPYAASATLDVFAPARPRGRPAPIVVTLHGCCGTGTDLFQLAYGLAESGAVVFNTTYRNLPEGGGYPVAYEQAAFAAAFARARGGS